VVLADTHIRRSALATPRTGPLGPLGRLPDAAYAHLEAADVILHAGDVLVGEVLDELGGFAPVHAVLGNNDAELGGVLPETQSIEIAGVRIAMVHDSGAAAGRAARLHRRFPDADVVVFGHSHIPWHHSGVDGQLLFNPGSPTERRAQPSRTLGTLDLEAGRIAGSRIHVLG
jgi:putative phosphoesterase